MPLEAFITTNRAPREGNSIEQTGFEEFGLQDEVLQAVRRAGFRSPSPIQSQVIPLILSGVDLVAQAQTGTGKTAAFGLPALSRMPVDAGVAMLVITPTRELAQQVGEELYRFGSGRGLRVAIIQGGSSSRSQLDQIRRGTQIVVATPGRLLDLLSSNPLPNFKPSIVVLDEADEMLNMGFLEDVQKIFTFLPQERQTLLFSATMPPQIQSLARKILKSPSFISATGKETANRDIQQLYYLIRAEERDAALLRLIHSHQPGKSIIFCQTKKDVDRVSTCLAQEGLAAKALHGDLEQNQRNRVTDSFRKGEIKFLVATDVAARGLNILDVTHVFNFQMPFESESYLHRIGRTGRAGRKGMAMTLVTAGELRRLRFVMKDHGCEVVQGQIPSKGDLRRKQVLALIQEIKQQPAAQEASSILSSLREELELQSISLNLISLLLSQQKLSGPDTIGLPPQDGKPHSPHAPRPKKDGPPKGGFKRFQKFVPKGAAPQGKKPFLNKGKRPKPPSRFGMWKTKKEGSAPTPR